MQTRAIKSILFIFDLIVLSRADTEMTDLTFLADFGTANFTLNSTNLSSMLQQFFVDNSHLTILNLNSSIQVEEYEGKCYPLVRKSPLSTCFLKTAVVTFLG